MSRSRRTCPECETQVGSKITDGVYMCRVCMKAVRVEDDGDPENKEDLFSDGGTDAVGFIEEIHASPDGFEVEITARLSPNGIDFHEQGLRIDGPLALDARDMDRVLDAFDVSEEDL